MLTLAYQILHMQPIASFVHVCSGYSPTARLTGCPYVSLDLQARSAISKQRDSKRGSWHDAWAQDARFDADVLYCKEDHSCSDSSWGCSQKRQVRGLTQRLGTQQPISCKVK